MSPFYDQKGQPRGYVIVLRDITERKQAQETIHQYAAELEARNRELSAFSHTIAHDLKNPVTNMDMIAQVLSLHASHESLEPAYLQEKLKDIRAASQKMNQMIDGLLLLSRLPETEVVTTQVEMTTVVESAIDRFEHELGQKKITVDVDGTLPPVCGYDIWLEEVVANLISNAIKYIGNTNPQPRITIRGYPQDKMIRYEVRDNGVGIPKEHQARLFEMFSRFHKQEAAGLGLGLSIVLRIVTRLNGEVGLESDEGQGSTFWFALPSKSTPSPAKVTDAG
jgi:signal transduction histidine kinase